MKPRALVPALVLLAACVLGGMFWYLNAGASITQAEPVIGGTSQVKPLAAPAPSHTISVSHENWEVQLEKIVHSALEMEDIADRLIVLFPRLPASGKEETAQHICDNVSDETYGKMRPLTVDAGLGVAVLDIFYTDLGNRDERVRLPVLLEIAKNTRHPFRKEATEEPTFILDTEPGQDFAQMEATMNAYLKQLEEEM